MRLSDTAILTVAAASIALAGIGAGYQYGRSSVRLPEPPQAAIDMLIYTSVRTGWVCRDNDVTFDECALMVRTGNQPR